MNDILRFIFALFLFYFFYEMIKAKAANKLNYFKHSLGEKV